MVLALNGHRQLKLHLDFLHYAFKTATKNLFNLWLFTFFIVSRNKNTIFKFQITTINVVLRIYMF